MSKDEARIRLLAIINDAIHACPWAQLKDVRKDLFASERAALDRALGCIPLGSILELIMRFPPCPQE